MVLHGTTTAPQDGEEQPCLASRNAGALSAGCVRCGFCLLPSTGSPVDGHRGCSFLALCPGPSRPQQHTCSDCSRAAPAPPSTSRSMGAASAAAAAHTPRQTGVHGPRSTGETGATSTGRPGCMTGDGVKESSNVEVDTRKAWLRGTLPMSPCAAQRRPVLTCPRCTLHACTHLTCTHALLLLLPCCLSQSGPSQDPSLGCQSPALSVCVTSPRPLAPVAASALVSRRRPAPWGSGEEVRDCAGGD